MDIVSHKQFRQLLADHAREHRIPLQGAFELTPVCNLDCKMCYVHLPEAVAKQRMLSGDEWIAVMDEAISAGMIYALLTGGEALTHPDFWKIYRHLNQKGIRIQLKSNGVFLCGENLQKLCEMPPDAIDISLYGCNGESYKAVTGQDMFDRVMENIRAVKDAGIPVRIMVTPCRAMMPWVEETIRLAKSFGAPVNVNAILVPPREGTERKLEESTLSLDDYCEVARLTKDILDTKPTVLDEAVRPKPQRPFSDAGLVCVAGRSMFAVRWEGRMVPCPGFPESLCEHDIRIFGFAEAWKRMNHAVETFVIPEQCSACTLNQVCHYCPTLHGVYAGKHQCNQEYCQYKYRLNELWRQTRE